MSTEVPLRCRCGKVRGVALGLSPDSGSRVVCYCGDCQAFAHFLQRPDSLDAAGGTDIFQMPPSSVRIDSGAELLRCMRLSEKGMVRWYTECCRTPIGNTMGAKVPFIGMIHSFMDHAAGRSRDEVLGKPLGYFQTRSAIGDVPAAASRIDEFLIIARSVRKLLGWWLRGKGSPSPFFDMQTLKPLGELRVLSVAERDALRRPGTVG
jgi:hypothetical protein